MADSISRRVEDVLRNVTDKRSRVERKMQKLRAMAVEATDEGSSPDAALDMSVLESETSRVKIYDKQIETMKQQLNRNEEINAKLLDDFSKQLREALNLQDYD